MNEMSSVITPVAPSAIHYLPIATTICAAIFAPILFRRWMKRRSGPHLLWWAIGVTTYGLGTFLEASITLVGNTFLLTKAWYVAGALLGGYPLAQGSVYLHLRRRTANRLTWITVPVLVILSVLVFASPVISANLLPHKPSGDILAWSWVRLCTPFVNLYAVTFLIGGAIFSAVHFARGSAPGDGKRALGNVLIAIGAILPGIGGSMAKAGVVEALYVGEFIGLLIIWAGFQVCVMAGAKTAAPQAATARGAREGASPATMATKSPITTSTS